MIISRGIYDNTRVMILGGERMGISRKFSARIYDWSSRSTTTVCLGCHHSHHLTETENKSSWKISIRPEFMIGALSLHKFSLLRLPLVAHHPQKEKEKIRRKFSAGIYDWRSRSTTSVCLGCHHLHDLTQNEKEKFSRKFFEPKFIIRSIAGPLLFANRLPPPT